MKLHLLPRMDFDGPRRSAPASAPSSVSSSESDVMDADEMRAIVDKMCEDDNEPATAAEPVDVALVCVCLPVKWMSQSFSEQPQPSF